jgi:hypothetical protein
MKEDDETLPKCRRRVQKMLFIDRTIRLLFLAYIFYIIFMKFNFLGFSTMLRGSNFDNDTIYERIVEISE